MRGGVGVPGEEPVGPQLARIIAAAAAAPTRALKKRMTTSLMPGAAGITALRINLASVEDRAVDADAFHRRAVRSLEQDSAAGAAADRARHVFLERDLARQVEVARELRDRFQHWRRPAREDLRRVTLFGAHCFQCVACEVRDVPAM